MSFQPSRCARSFALCVVIPCFAFTPLPAQEPDKVNYPEITRGMNNVVVSPHGTHVAFTALSRINTYELVLCDVTTGLDVSRVKLASSPGNLNLAFSPDGKSILVGRRGAGQGVKGVKEPQPIIMDLWDVSDVKKPIRLRSIDMEQGEGGRGVFTSDGKSLVVNHFHGAFSVYDPATGKRKFAAAGTHPKAVRVAVSPDDRFVLVGHVSGHVSVWDLTLRKELRVIQLGKKEVEHVAFSPKGDRFVVADRDNQVVVFETKTGKLLKKAALKEHRVGGLRVCQFLNDGKAILLVGYGAAPGMGTWNPDTGVFLGPQAKSREEKSVVFTHAALARDGGRLATVQARTLKSWDVPALLKELKPLPAEPEK